jgi:hypothetical protein
MRTFSVRRAWRAPGGGGASAQRRTPDTRCAAHAAAPSNERRALAVAARVRVDVKGAAVHRELAGAGIDSVLIKGPVTSALLGDRDRSYGDWDLLVEPTSHAAAEELLRKLGFTPLTLRGDASHELRHHASTWLRPSDGALIDLHQTLPGATADAAVVWSELRHHRDSIGVASISVPTLDRPASAMVLALHAANHGPANHSRTLEELSAGIRVLPEPVWRAADALAQRIGTGERFCAGLSLVPEGRALLAALGRRFVPSPEQAFLWSGAQGARRLLALQVAGTHRERFRVLGTALFPQPRSMPQYSALARRGRAGLVAAYAARPFVLLVRMPAVLRASRRLRSGA